MNTGIDPFLSIKKAALHLSLGKLVAFPTETVYGLGADAENIKAINSLYAVKGRPTTHPVIVHIALTADLEYWVKSVPKSVHQLIAAFWPGPLTLIFKRASHINSVISGGQDSIGLRCPSHPVAQQLLKSFSMTKAGKHSGLAAPSANRFGYISPTLARHVQDDFPYEAAKNLLILEGGRTQIGIESTILDVSNLDSNSVPVIVRPGSITATQIATVLGVLPSSESLENKPRAPGTLKSHYSPKTALRIVSEKEIEQISKESMRSLHAKHRAILTYKPVLNTGASHLQWYRISKDPVRYAQTIYALLRLLDKRGYDIIFVQAPPCDESWLAINDRVSHASATIPEQLE